MPPSNLRHIIRPDTAFLRESGKLLLTTRDMALFLQIPRAAVQQLSYSDRIPLPLHLGLGRLPRWSVFELLEWTEAGCPRRSQWIELRGTSGWLPAYRWGDGGSRERERTGGLLLGILPDSCSLAFSIAMAVAGVG